MIDVNETIERIGVSRLGILVLVLCFCMMIGDGFDFASLAVAVPAILRNWHVTPRQMGVVFSVTFIGLLVGSLFYGWLADRFGRKFTIIFGTLNFGIPVLLTVWTTNPTELAVLRFIAGMGMGGIVPVAFTLVSDYAPRRARSSVTILTNAGYSIGAVLTGIAAAALIPRLGWQSLFVLGGAFSLIMAIVLTIALPESPRYLALKHPGSPRLRTIVQRLMPDRTIEKDTIFVPGDLQEQQTKTGSKDNILQLFYGPRRTATILLWVLFIADSLGFFFLASWLPVVMERQGVAPQIASLTQSLFVFMGMTGGLIMMRFLDRHGPIAVLPLPIIGATLEILMGAHGLSLPVLLFAVAGAGIGLSGFHYTVYAIAVRFYPASIRARGISSATVWGRAGGIIAPYVGGFFLSTHMPLQQLMLIAATPCILTALTVIGLGQLHTRHFEVYTEAPATATA